MALKATVTLGSTDLLRLERASLLARYDNGALSSAVFAVIKKLEVEIAWRQHAKLLRTEEGCVYGYFSLPSSTATQPKGKR